MTDQEISRGRQSFFDFCCTFGTFSPEEKFPPANNGILDLDRRSTKTAAKTTQTQGNCSEGPTLHFPPATRLHTGQTATWSTSTFWASWAALPEEIPSRQKIFVTANRYLEGPNWTSTLHLPHTTFEFTNLVEFIPLWQTFSHRETNHRLDTTCTYI